MQHKGARQQHTAEPINTHSNQKQPGNFDEILQAKTYLEKYLKGICLLEHY